MTDCDEFDGKVAFITGGASGIGLAAAKRLANPRTSFCTGGKYRVDGGLMAKIGLMLAE